MKIYMHCLTNQDLTKQFAYTNEIRKEFFDDAKDQEEISIIGITSEREQKVRILTATDSRLNANFQFILSQEGSATIGDIVIFYKIGFRKYNLELIQKSNPKYQTYKDLFSDPRHLPIYTNSEQIQNDEITNKTISPLTPTTLYEQTIYYGVPGSGKSRKIDEKTKFVSDEQKIRVVFHPEYTNADFVGQILPVVDGDAVKYTFKPGAFTRILVAALKNPEKPYYLIIEEINRGNAAAIFGEIFQLLDRGSDGWSSYCIMNDDINYEIRKTVPELNWTANTGIRLPPNLSLFATMNTSDQNVFTLDNAFQRRWEMELVQNQCDDSSQMNAKITVNNQSITWKNFQTQINSIIGEKSNEGGLSSMEDKRLGCWFIKAENGVIDEKKFANKVLKYLWDDAFKFYHQEIFESDIKNFEELQKRFAEKGFDVFSENCGLKDFLSTTQPDSESKSETTTPKDSESQSENSEQ